MGHTAPGAWNCWRGRTAAAAKQRIFSTWPAHHSVSRARQSNGCNGREHRAALGRLARHAELRGLVLGALLDDDLILLRNESIVPSHREILETLIQVDRHKVADAAAKRIERSGGRARVNRRGVALHLFEHLDTVLAVRELLLPRLENLTPRLHKRLIRLRLVHGVGCASLLYCAVCLEKGGGDCEFCHLLTYRDFVIERQDREVQRRGLRYCDSALVIEPEERADFLHARESGHGYV